MSGAHFSIFIRQEWRKDCNDDWDLPTVLYSKCSLSAQHAKKFPTSVLEDAVHLTNQLERLSEAWVWWNDPFEYCGFGTPSIRGPILNEMFGGVFKPQIFEGRSKRARIKYRIFAKEAQKSLSSKLLKRNLSEIQPSTFAHQEAKTYSKSGQRSCFE